MVSIVILHKILCSVVCGDEGSGGDTELSGCGPATLFRQWTTTKLAYSTKHLRARASAQVLLILDPRPPKTEKGSSRRDGPAGIEAK